MPNLGEFRTRTVRAGQGYVNTTVEDDLATYKQLDLIDRLRQERALDPLPRQVSSIMTKDQAGAEIDGLLATPKYQGPPPTPDGCPPGWDEDVWALSLRFRAYARHDGIELAAGLPVIYAEIEALVTRWQMRERAASHEYVQEVDGCTRRHLPADMADRCWYHWPPHQVHAQVARELTWQQMIAIIMAEFWSRIQDPYALSRLSQYFAEYGGEAVRHWRGLRAQRDIASQPRPERRIIRPRGSMQDVSKEG